MIALPMGRFVHIAVRCCASDLAPAALNVEKRGAARRFDDDGSTVVDRVRTVSRAQVRQPVNANGLGRWRAYASELAPLIAELEAVESLAGWGA
jgi:hypothetical protein